MAAADRTIISIEDFFEDPVRGMARISPDGTKIAHIAPAGRRMNVWLRNVEDGETVQVTNDQNRGVYNFKFTRDPRWFLYMQDTDGNEDWHLYRVDLDDPEADAVDMTPMDPGSRVMTFELLEGQPDKVLVVANWPRPALLDAHLLDLATGELTVLAENPGNVVGWIPTPSGDLLTMSETEDHDYVFGEWDPSTNTARDFARFPGEDFVYGVAPAHVTPDGTGLLVGAYGDGDHLRLTRIDIATGEQTVVHEEPGHDLDVMRAMMGGGSPVLRDNDGNPLAAFYVGDRQIVRPFDDRSAAILDAIGDLSDGDIAGISCDDDGRRWVVAFDSDTDPGPTYLYDHETGESEFLFRPYPHLDPATLAPMRPMSFTSRDGLRIPCLLTLPLGVEPKNLPLVLNIHGGPWARDGWGYNREVQFLANRGYAVLQVNFRGSIGYGKSFTKAAMRQFAGTMHDDLVDAVNWAVEEGYADPDRICIYGGSYGGYAALVGATFTPDLFACAIDNCGISNLAEFLRSWPPFLRHVMFNNWGRYVGDPDDPADEADMLARSPITRIDDLTIPLMVVQGANDTRVRQAESDNIVEGLRARGVEVEYVLKDDEGHGYMNRENIMDMWRVAEKFLERHLG